MKILKFEVRINQENNILLHIHILTYVIMRILRRNENVAQEKH